jgi:outer membrane protein assembly factor BamB
MSYNPETGSFYVSGTIRTSAFARYGDTYKLGLRYTGGTQAAPIGSAMSGTFTAIGGNTNKIVWQHKTPYRVGQGGGSTTTAGGLVFRGEPDGIFLAIDAKTGQELWRFQTGFGADAPSAVYEVNGEEYVAIAAGGLCCANWKKRRKPRLIKPLTRRSGRSQPAFFLYTLKRAREEAARRACREGRRTWES